MSERPKELASKASVVQATEGSNPSVTATDEGLGKPGPSSFPGRIPDEAAAGPWSVPVLGEEVPQQLSRLIAPDAGHHLDAVVQSGVTDHVPQ